jgi:bacteriocin leader peptide (microcyclamide/patellamide family)
MNNKSITPNPQQPVDRVPTGQLPNALAELSEEILDGLMGYSVLPQSEPFCKDAGMYGKGCSFDGDDE